MLWKNKDVKMEDSEINTLVRLNKQTSYKNIYM